MESSIFRQIAELAREHKTAARATAVFLCLALVVTLTTVGVLTHTGQAMTQKVKVLTCPLEVHEHTDDCRDGDGNLICGYADYVVHIHNDDCYGEDGSLVCSLPEVRPHTHDASCYQEVKTPICGQEEAQGHVHTAECYDRQQGALICTQEEHTHGPECFLHEETLTCDKTEQEHVHGDGCYTVTRELTCGQEEGEEHTHSDACYTETRTLTCDLVTEPHVHGPECYTVSDTLVCEIPEHTHSDACYEWTETLICDIPEGQIPEGGHVHTDECYEVTTELTCGKLENHEHTDDCFVLDADGNRTGLPICGKMELLEHVHGEECFTIEERVIEDQPSTGTFFFQVQDTADLEVCDKIEHTHDETCLDENGELVCGLEEHVHDASCFPAAPAESATAPEAEELPAEPELICGKEEHTHDETCLDENGEVVCGLEEHTHDASCLAPAPEAEELPAEPEYICGKEEHTHDETCLDENGELVCGKEEHTHSDTCLPLTAETYETLCGKEEHTHDETCLNEAGEIVCGKEEHTHDESCLALPEGTFVRTWQDASTLITARYTAEAQLPEDVVLQAYRVTPEYDIARYEDRVETALDALDEKPTAGATMLVYNIGFYTVDGVEVEPAAPVAITIQFLDANGLPVGSPVKVVHFAKDGIQTMEGSTVDDSNSTSFVTNSFSDFSLFLPPILNGEYFLYGGEPRLTSLEVPGDLESFIEGMKLQKQDENGNWVDMETDDQVVLGNNYRLYVTFKNGTDKFQPEMKWSLGENVTCSPKKDAPIMDGSKQVGTYDLTENGEVTVHFTDQDFLNSAEQELEMHFDMTVTGDKGNEEHRFPWSGHITDKTEVSKDANLAVQKTASKYNEDSFSVSYKVEATVTQGMIKDGTLTDQMADGMYFRDYDEGNMHVYDADGNDVTEKYMDPWINDLIEQFKEMENGKQEKTEEQRENRFELKLPPMTQGMRFVVEYESYIPDAQRGNLKYVAENTVTFKGTVPGEKEPKTATDDASIPVGGDQVKKLGTLETLVIDGVKTDVIKWTVRLGTGIGDPLVYDPLYVTDTLGTGLTFVQSEAIQVQWYGKDNTVKAAGHIGWDAVDVDGQVAKFDLPEQGAYKDGTQLFGQLYDWQDGDYVEVSYYTTFDPTKEPNSGFENTVQSVLTADKHGITGTLPVGSSVQKTVVDDEENSCLRYTILVDIPDSGSMKKMDEDEDHPGLSYFRIEDELDFDWGAYVLNVPENVTVYAEGKTSNKTYTFTKEPYLSGPGDGVARETFQVLQGPESPTDAAVTRKNVRAFRIYFNTAHYGLGNDNVLNATDSIWDITEPTTLTIIYEIPYSSAIYNEDGTDAGMTLLEALMTLDRNLENKVEAWFDDDDMNVKAFFKKDKTEQGIDKIANILSGGEVEYSVSFVNSDYKVNTDGKFSQLIKKPGKDNGCDKLLPRLVDTFDQHMEYVEGSLRVDVYNFEGTKRYASYKYTGGISGADPTDSTNTLTAKLYEDGDWDQEWNDGSHYKWPDEKGNSQQEITDTFNAQRKYVFVYKLRLKDEYRKLMTTAENIENKAEFKYGDMTLDDSTKVNIPSDMLQKDLVPLDNNRLQYTLKVNSLGANLVDYESSEGFVNLSSYKLVDKMSENLHLLTDANGYKIDVLYQTSEGEWLPLTRSTNQDSISKEYLNYYLGTEEDGSIFFILPDELPIQIQYEVMITGAKNSQELASNEATLYADTKETDHKEKIYQVGESGATASGTAGVRLIKKDSSDGDQLKDATFALYSSKGPRDSSIGEEIAKITVMQDGKEVTLYPVKLYTTNDYGEILDIVPVKGSEDALYALKETQAPPDYIMDEDPVFFYFPEQGKAGETVIYGESEYKVRNPKTDEAFTFENTRNAFMLPESGGGGYAPLYAVGIAMLTLSAVMLLERDTRRRRREEDA